MRGQRCAEWKGGESSCRKESEVMRKTEVQGAAVLNNNEHIMGQVGLPV